MTPDPVQCIYDGRSVGSGQLVFPARILPSVCQLTIAAPQYTHYTQAFTVHICYIHIHSILDIYYINTFKHYTWTLHYTRNIYREYTHTLVTVLIFWAATAKPQNLKTFRGQHLFINMLPPAVREEHFMNPGAHLISWMVRLWINVNKICYVFCNILKLNRVANIILYNLSYNLWTFQKIKYCISLYEQTFV